jgi:Leucine-rich repeat (LRR) protein
MVWQPLQDHELKLTKNCQNHSCFHPRSLKSKLCARKMCRDYLIILLFGLIFIRDTSANGWVCKNNPQKSIQNSIAYNIEHCENTEIDLGDERSLIHVRAWDNQISKISDDTFKSAKQLIHIDLRENMIEQISVGAFKDQAKLEKLYLKYNKLTRIEVGTFDSLVELKELWLQNNQLSLIEKGLFDQNTKLEELYMASNKIIAIETKVFTKLNRIKSLTLKGNLCVNQDFTSNNFERDFNCFENYEDSKPNLDEADQRKDEPTDHLRESESIGSTDCAHEYKNILLILIIVICVLVILSIAFLISIVKICKLSKDNKFLNAKLDKLCEDHVYEKVDYNLHDSSKNP